MFPNLFISILVFGRQAFCFGVVSVIERSNLIFMVLYPYWHSITPEDALWRVDVGGACRTIIEEFVVSLSISYCVI